MSVAEHFRKEIDYIRRTGCQRLYTPEGVLYRCYDPRPREPAVDFGRGPCYPQFARAVIRFDGIVKGSPNVGLIVAFVEATDRGSFATAESSW